MKKFLKSFDQFGVPLTQSVNKDEPFYRSVAGGLVSLMIYTASLSYAIYVIVLWWNRQFSPKVSTTMKELNLTGEDMNFSVFHLGFWKQNDSFLDPFKAQGNILTPLLYFPSNNAENNLVNILNDDVGDVTNYNVQKISPILNLKFVSDPITGETYINQDVFLLLVKCQDKYMKPGQYCAPQVQIDAFFKQPLNNIMLYQKYTNLNPVNQEKVQHVDILYFQIEELTCNSNNLKLKTTQYEIKESFIPGRSKFQTHITGSTNQGQISSTQYCKNGFNVDALLVLYLLVDGQQTNALFEYPNGGDILANIGSIVSILFMAKYIIVAFNSYFLQEAIISQLYEYYYPEFHKIIVKSNWLKKIKSVSFNGKSIDIDAYQRFELRLRNMMLSKISLTNMIYELSRLEFIVRSIIPQENLRKCHGVGIRVRLKELKHADAQIDIELDPTVVRYDIKPLMLVDEDCNVLSLDHRQHYRTNKIDEEVLHDNFYDVNQIII